MKPFPRHKYNIYPYALCIVHISRILLVCLLDMSAMDNGDNIKDDARTDIPLVGLYGAKSRLLNDSKPEVLKFSYCEVMLYR